jgi:hypothetical protein
MPGVHVPLQEFCSRLQPDQVAYVLECLRKQQGVGRYGATIRGTPGAVIVVPLGRTYATR